MPPKTPPALPPTATPELGELIQQWGGPAGGLFVLLWVATKVPAITQKWIPGLAAWFALRFKSKDEELAELRKELKEQQGKNTSILEAQLVESNKEVDFWRDMALRALADDGTAVRREIEERVIRGSLPGVSIEEISQAEEVSHDAE